MNVVLQFCEFYKEFPCEWFVSNVVWKSNGVEELTEMNGLAMNK